MASYAAPNDVRAALAPASQFTAPGTAASLDDPTIQVAIDEAQAQVDSTLAVRYFTPFDKNPDGTTPSHIWPDGTTHAVPFMIFQVTRDIAAYLATLVARQGKDMTPNEPVARRYTRVVGTPQQPGILNQLRNGDITLDVELAGAQADRGGEMVVANVYDGTMWQTEDLGISAVPGGGVDIIPGGWPRGRGWW